MSRTVLTYPDLPPVLTQAAADTRYVNVTGDQMTGNLGVGVAPAAWRSDLKAVQVGNGALWDDGGMNLYATSNTAWDAGGPKALVVGAGTLLNLAGGALSLQTAPSVGAGAAQTFTTRLQVAQTGTVTLTPDAGQVALAWGGAAGGVLDMNGPNPRLRSTAGQSLELSGASNFVHPGPDNTTNFGAPSNRWSALYAVAGTINTSTVEAKQDITPLAPEDALAEVLRVPVYRFRYKPPNREPLPDDMEEEARAQAQAQRDASAVYENYERIGFMAEEAHHPDGDDHDCLLLVGPDSVEPQNTAGVLMAALQALAKRVQALEAARV